jgi:hypothetical protein
MSVLPLCPILTKTANDLDSKIVRVNWSMAVSDYRCQIWHEVRSCRLCSTAVRRSDLRAKIAEPGTMKLLLAGSMLVLGSIR